MSEQERYSDAELEEFRQLILAKLAKAEEEFENYRQVASGTDEGSGTEASATLKSLGDGTYTRDKEEAARIAERQRKFIQHLRAALVRIDNKTYGICRVTGKLIPKERLRAVPHATLSVDAKEGGKR